MANTTAIAALRATRAALGGAKWLDQNAAGWTDNLDIDTLRVANRCLIGQIFHNYQPARRYYRPVRTGNPFERRAYRNRVRL